MTKQHYFLISGTVMFSFPNPEQPDQPNISSVPCNAIVRHDDTNFPAHKLGKAQQNLHKSFALKMPEEVRPALQVHDIIVMAVSHLGEMTEEEFQAAPEGHVDVTDVPVQSSAALEA